MRNYLVLIDEVLVVRNATPAANLEKCSTKCILPSLIVVVRQPDFV